MEGRIGLRVGSGQTFCRQSRVGSGRVKVAPGRVGPRKVTRGQLCTIVGYSRALINYSSIIQVEGNGTGYGR